VSGGEVDECTEARLLLGFRFHFTAAVRSPRSNTLQIGHQPLPLAINPIPLLLAPHPRLTPPRNVTEESQFSIVSLQHFTRGRVCPGLSHP
jgi:hypothetical protein